MKTSFGDVSLRSTDMFGDDDRRLSGGIVGRS